MKRFTNRWAVLASASLIAAVACSTKQDNATDTTMAIGDTTAVSSTTAMPAPATPNTTASSTSGSSTSGIVPININTATDAQILAIPGVGPRMLREFKEYRPYTSIEQFRREIGKYVDKAEVARLEQYIVIK
jgi:DNA uptake protein ComE-like DNA-binding protein